MSVLTLERIGRFLRLTDGDEINMSRKGWTVL